jgi:hypothetical protein
MYVVVRDYRNESPEALARAKRRQDDLKRAMGGIKGLIAYYVVDTGGGDVATISFLEDEADVAESLRVAAEWVRANMAEWVPNPPTVIQGEVAIGMSRARGLP